ncbi:MAG: (2Fe-2S)-binding protein [Phycisphaerales bacterium]|nr:(2Fe-2S)-binding protein [Phycisphaerales bacterium]
MQHFIEREKPKVPSQLSQCLDAGTGCRWCVPFLCKMHRQWTAGESMDLAVSPEEYAERRGAYKRAGVKHDPLTEQPTPPINP